MKLKLSKFKGGYWPAVIIISTVMTLLNSLSFFIGLLRTPANTVYLGTIHYYEDFFYYVSNFFQGAHGAWLVASRYTTEPTIPTVIHWQNLLMGKIGALLFLRPEMAYNVFVLIFAFSSLLIGFLIMQHFFPNQPKLAFTGFLFSTFAASWMNHIVVDGKPLWYPFQLWKTPHFAFDRQGGVPHQLLVTNLFLLLVLFFFRKSGSHQQTKSTVLAATVALLLTSINPYPALLLVVATWLVWSWLVLQYKNSQADLLKRLTVVSLVVVVGLGFVSYGFNLPPYLQAKLWEAQQQTRTTVPFLIASIGPVLILAGFGVIPFLKQPIPLYRLAAILPLLAYALFMSPIPKLLGAATDRFIFPGLYVFFGALAVQGCLTIAKTVGRKGNALKQRVVFTTLVILFLVASTPTLWWEVMQKNQNTVGPDSALTYLPADIYRGFLFLSRIKPYEDVAVASPISRMDILLPALSGHTGYSGHILFTINPGEKSQQSALLFTLSLSQEQAQNWLEINRIRYVVFTQYDGNRDQFLTSYPFLHTIYDTQAITIFTL